ncbi:hypothetical protein LCGC14_2219820 [marine sediment metagenome]|uniref:Uncharacterized protein n=1 Tax=marine sediment metagenome TaxID=412755 RepID=A0A0F9G6W9_9ZZZZ
MTKDDKEFLAVMLYVMSFGGLFPIIIVGLIICNWQELVVWIRNLI